MIRINVDDPPLDFTEEAAEACANNQPVVALESTIITHGMPYPENLETARAVEATVRAAGAVPATIAVMDGRIQVGLDAERLARLAEAGTATKVSRAELAACLASGQTGATTVSATMIAAHLAGIRVFGTGGIGGVHHGGDASFDISADLQELSRTPVTVVCAGAKAILDLPKTFEVLETLGVPVIAVGQDEVPAFWSRQSGVPAALRMDSAGEIARAGLIADALGLSTGQLVANPIPAEDEIPAKVLAPLIAQAQADADARGISGKAVTPFLLQRLLELTEGRTLVSNMALVLNNARLAAEIARKFIALKDDTRP